MIVLTCRLSGRVTTLMLTTGGQFKSRGQLKQRLIWLPDLWVSEVKKYRDSIDQNVVTERERLKELQRLRDLADKYKSGLVAVSFCLFVFVCAVLTEAAK
jgi:hypothetical protein